MNLKILNKYYEEGWLIKQHHPTLPLTIWNYSQQTQYEKYWNEITLACRGLVTWDDQDDVVARPFKKFFNIEEGKYTPTKNYNVYKKMDGSLIIAFYFQGSWIFASRGSFTSYQALAASKLFYSEYNYQGMNIDTTYLFEFTAPWNRIVVDYGDRENLTLLGAIRTEDGLEAPWQHLYHVSRLNGIDLVEMFDGVSDYTQLKQAIYNDEEGYVVRFSNGDRIKIKGEEYLRLHKVMTGVSTTSIWETLSKGDDLYELLKNVPDEFFDKIDEYANGLVTEYIIIEAKCEATFNLYKSLERKEFAKAVKYNKYSGILFKMYDNRDYSENIWKLIKPAFRRL